MFYAPTFYGPVAGVDAQRPALSGPVEADVCVVGGGLAGLTAALELARRGRKVCLLEGERIAWGASGRNGGFVRRPAQSPEGLSGTTPILPVHAHSR